MIRILPGLAAIALLASLGTAGPANASEQRQDGVRNQHQGVTDVSARKRHYYRGYHVRRHWGPRWGYYPRYRHWGGAYAYDPYYRPYYGPRAYIGPFGFGIGVGPRW
jgi:hypothetical protein